MKPVIAAGRAGPAIAAYAESRSTQVCRGGVVARCDEHADAVGDYAQAEHLVLSPVEHYAMLTARRFSRRARALAAAFEEPCMLQSAALGYISPPTGAPYTPRDAQKKKAARGRLFALYALLLLHARRAAPRMAQKKRHVGHGRQGTHIARLAGVRF